MKLRLRNRFKNRDTASVEEKANILAYNLWQISLAGAKNLHVEDYVYENDAQRVGVIREYLIFLVHIADRLSFDALDAEERGKFISTLANDTARQLQRNTEEVMGSGDYKSGFFALINERFTEYSQGKFDEGKPGYALYRMFGAHVRDVMGDDQTNKWTIDQIMDKDGPEMVEKMQASMQAVLGNADPNANKSSVELLLDNTPPS